MKYFDDIQETIAFILRQIKNTLASGSTAGGDLTGTYPNPTVDVLKITNSKIANATIDLTTKVTGVLPIANGGTNRSVALTGKRLSLTSGDIATTSQTLVDLTGASITITTGANPVLIVVKANWTNSFVNYSNYITVDIDGVTIGEIEQNATAAGHWYNASFSHLTAALSAASHTFKLQWKVNGYTGTIRASATYPLHFAVIEQLNVLV